MGLFTPIKNLLGLANTWSANQVLNGTNNTAPNQTAAGSSSLMTMGLSDTRYGPFYRLITTADISSASTTYTNGSDTLIIPVGTYNYYSQIYADTASTTGGISAFLGISANNDTAGVYLSKLIWAAAQNNNGSSLVISSVAFRNQNSSALFQYACGAIQDASQGQTVVGEFSGWVTFNASTSLNFKVAQRNVIDSTNAAILRKNSHITLIKIA